MRTRTPVATSTRSRRDRRDLSLVGAAILLLVGCAVGGRTSRSTRGQISISMDQVRYDGFKLWGRLLVHADSDVVIDRRLGFEVVQVSDVVDCDSGRPVEKRLIVDYAWRERSAGDLIALRRGEWFGVEADFWLFAEQFSPSGGPSCIRFTVDVATSGEPFSGWNASWKGERGRQPPPE